MLAHVRAFLKINAKLQVQENLSRVKHARGRAHVCGRVVLPQSRLPPGPWFPCSCFAVVVFYVLLCLCCLFVLLCVCVVVVFCCCFGSPLVSLPWPVSPTWVFLPVVGLCSQGPLVFPLSVWGGGGAVVLGWGWGCVVFLLFSSVVVFSIYEIVFRAGPLKIHPHPNFTFEKNNIFWVWNISGFAQIHIYIYDRTSAWRFSSLLQLSIILIWILDTSDLCPNPGMGF